MRHPLRSILWFLPWIGLLPNSAWTRPQQPDRTDRRDGVFLEAMIGLPVQPEDELPLPLPAIGRASSSGDTILSPASGNPYYLGFAAGPYFPPNDERIDPALIRALEQRPMDGRPAHITYGFAMFAQRITEERIREIEDLGVRVLGFHPFHALKVAGTAEALTALSAHPAIRWVGMARSWQKVHPHLAAQLESAGTGDVLDVFIDVFESDLGPSSTFAAYPGAEPRVVAPHGEAHPAETSSAGPTVRVWQSNGWQQRALEARGVTIDRYLPEVDAFCARLPFEQIDHLLALDFVQFVELQVAVQPAHDESIPLIHADETRRDYDGGTNAVAVVGIIDSGYENTHSMLDHLFGLGFDLTMSTGAFDDPCGHGSHVAGTLAGEPDAGSEGLRGVAPGLAGRIPLAMRHTRIFPGTSFGVCGSAFGTLTDRLVTMRNVEMRGLYTYDKPHVVNCSWRAPTIGSPYVGTEVDARTLDAEVWDYDQFYVFAAGNEGAQGNGTIGLPSVAKNAFTVGSVLDFHELAVGYPGEVAASSSRGPCGDGRWKPNVVAPGRYVRSADSRQPGDTIERDGSSTATPHVSGLAAQLVDHYAGMRFAPHRLASLIMATATTRNDQLLTTAADLHLRNYGAGRVDAWRAHWNNGQMSWRNWNGTVTNSWIYGDFTIDPNATRVIVCMSYVEDQASAGASQALVKDLDLWIDRDPIDPNNGNTGEYNIQQSRVDNTEIRSIANPPAGPWRWKVYPATTTGTARVSVTVVEVYADTTPALFMSLSQDKTYVRPNEDVTLTTIVTNPDFVASGVFLETNAAAQGGVSVTASRTTLKDGALADLTNNRHGGRNVLLGDLYNAQSRTWDLTVNFASEGLKTWQVDSVSDNALPATRSTQIYVDGTDPSLVTNLASSSHTPNVWSNDDSIRYRWTAATDNLSGVDGYAVDTSHDPNGAPQRLRTIGDVVTFAEVLATSNQPYFFKIRTVDRSGNWTNGFARTGPYLIDTVQPTAATNFLSPTHQVGSWSNLVDVTVNWTSAHDAHSGLQGYAAVWDQSPTTDPAGALVLGPLDVTATRRLAGSPSAFFFHLRARDVAGNWGPTAHFGPILIDDRPPQGPIVTIDGGNASTTSTSVTLAWMASDDLSGLSAMRFQNDGGTFSPWEPYATTRSWDLLQLGGSNARGTRTVVVEVQDVAGNVSQGAGTIYLYDPPNYFGVGCAGSAGLPTFDVTGPIGAGQVVSFDVGNTQASLEVLYAGLSDSNYLGIPLPFDLGLIGSPGCSAYVSLESVLHSGLPGSLAVAIPADPVFTGATVFLQAFLIGDPSGRLVITTRAARTVLAGV
ncbi:MAG: S8 family peptidase [Planctomycetes bacterium]|nr:S8 family peptidase [Planctomycetota bacterium]